VTSPYVTLFWRDYGRPEGAAISRHLLTGDTGRHDHDFLELAVVIGGVAVHVSGACEVPIARGFAVLLRPGSWHAYRACNSLDVINFCFPVAMARAEWRELLDERVRSVLRSGELLQTTIFSDSAIDCLDLLERTERRSTGALGLMIWALDQFASNVVVGSSLHPAVEKALCALEDHPSEGWTATQLSEAVGLDRAYLSRLFKAHVGVGPMSYLAMLRAERAALLLRGSQLNCGEVGLAVGYSDANLFSRRFRSRFGVSPSRYRNRWLTEQEK